MKKINFSRKNIILFLVVLVSLVLACVLSVVRGAFVSTQPAQAAVAGWAAGNDDEYAMVSIFFDRDTNLTVEMVERFDYYLDEELKSESIEAASENARTHIIACSKSVKAQFSTERAGTVSLNCTVVGGDFFRFHPFTLVDGCYINEEGVMKNNVVLDEMAAWKLFGAIDVKGMSLYAGDEEFIVAGVVKSDDTMLAKKAGYKDEGMMYFPFSLAEAIGVTEVDCMEIVFPNPVSGFAVKHIKKVAETSGMGEGDIDIVENSARYSLVNSVKRIVSFTTRGMRTGNISYPYWENAAIGVENIVDVINIFFLIFVFIPAVIIIVSIIRFHPIHRLGMLVKAVYEKIRR